MSKNYSPSDLAGWTNLTRQGVAKAFRKPPLSGAKVGKLINIEHPAAREWLQGHGVDPAQIDPVTKLLGVSKSGPEFPNSDPSPTRETIPQDQPPSEILSMTLYQITERHGTAPEFVDWLKARKELAMVQMRETQHDELQGRLIERELVEKVLLGFLDELCSRMLTDTAKTLSRKCHQDGASGVLVAETETHAVKAIGDQIKATKARVTRELRKKAKQNEEPTV